MGRNGVSARICPLTPSLHPSSLPSIPPFYPIDHVVHSRHHRPFSPCRLIFFCFFFLLLLILVSGGNGSVSLFSEMKQIYKKIRNFVVSHGDVILSWVKDNKNKLVYTYAKWVSQPTYSTLTRQSDTPLPFSSSHSVSLGGQRVWC